MAKNYLMLPISEARQKWIQRVMIEHDKAQSFVRTMVRNGYEAVACSEEIDFLPDGRSVVRGFGQAWALLPALHAEKIKAGLEAAKKVSRPGTKSVLGTESLSAMVCPKCGDALQHAAVCPKCAAGKLGYRHRYTCVCGGADLISKDKL
jgi:rubrerythrin